MENPSQISKQSRIRTVLLGSGTALSGVLLVMSLLFVARLGELIGYGGAIGILLGSGVISALLMPAVYFLVNRFKSRLWGRYHMTLAVATLISALCLVLFWCTDPASHIAARVTAVCICLPLCSIGLMLIAYICYSVNVRLMGEERGGFKSKCAVCFVGLVLGAASAALPLFGLDNSAVGYALGCLVLAVGTVFYFASVSSLPRFVRPLPHKFTVGLVKERFAVKPSRSAVLTTVALFVSVAVCSLLLGYFPLLSQSYSLADHVPLVCVCLSAVAGVAAYALARRAKLRLKAAIATSAVTCLVAVGLYVFARFAAVDRLILSLVYGIGYAVAGGCLGLCLGALHGYSTTYRSSVIGGVRFCFGAIIVVLGYFVGAAAAAVCACLPTAIGRLVFALTSAVLAGGTSALAISEFVLKRRTTKE